MELWKEIPGFNGRYSISSLGKVRNNKTGSIKKNQRDSSGYAAVKLYRTRKVEDLPRRVHRLVADAFLPNPENKPEINHLDLNKMNPALKNLEWTTRGENLKHFFSSGGKRNRGKRNSMVNVPGKPIRAILPSGESRDYISRMAAANSLGIKNSKIFDAIRNNHKCFGIQFINISEAAVTAS